MKSKLKLINSIIKRKELKKKLLWQLKQN